MSIKCVQGIRNVVNTDQDENSMPGSTCGSPSSIEDGQEVDIMNISQDKTENSSQPVQSNEESSVSGNRIASVSENAEKDRAAGQANTQKGSTAQVLKKKDGAQRGRCLFVSPKKSAATFKRPPKGSTSDAVQSTVSMASAALATMNNIFASKQASSKRDECDIFGEQVAVKLMKLPDRQRMIVQHKKNTLMFQAEMATLSPSPQPNVWACNSHPYPASRAYSEPPPTAPSDTLTYHQSSENLSMSLPNSPAVANNWNMENSPPGHIWNNAATGSSSDIGIGQCDFPLTPNNSSGM